MDNTKAVEEIRRKIRSGMKTSAIILEGKHPIDLIKSVKSEEIELDAKLAQEQKKAEQLDQMDRKNQKRDQEFMQKYDLNKDQSAT